MLEIARYDTPLRCLGALSLVQRGKYWLAGGRVGGASISNAACRREREGRRRKRTWILMRVSHTHTHTHTQQPGLLEFIPALLSCEQVASKCRQWRLHEELLKHLSFLVHCMTSDQLYSKFVPLTFKCITGNVSVIISVYVCACHHVASHSRVYILALLQASFLRGFGHITCN